jgi:hypothetical protein
MLASSEPRTGNGNNFRLTGDVVRRVLMTGQPIISIDNLNGDLGGDFVCQAIERPIIKPRILGRSETKRIDNTVSMFGSQDMIEQERALILQ